MDPLGGDGSGDGDTERRGAGRGRGRGPWTSTSQEIPALRRPHHTLTGLQTGSSESKSTEQSKLEKSYDAIIQNSTLSVHAAEFVPKSFPAKQSSQQTVRNIQKHSVQDRLQIAREIPFQGQMIQQNAGYNYDTSQHYQRREQVRRRPFSIFRDIKNQQQRVAFDSPVVRLAGVFDSLKKDPGCYDSIVTPVINEIANHPEFLSETELIIHITISHILGEDSISYNGARLFVSLEAVRPPTEQTRFRQQLYIGCQQTVKCTQPGSDYKENESCCRLILFLAELVAQMEQTSTFGIGDLLIQYIFDILNKSSKTFIKTVCQALKLAGQTLEKDKEESHKKMESIMQALNELVINDSMDSSIVNMVHSVNELRNRNWGRNTSNELSTVESTTEEIDPDQAINEPVFYGPDGKVLTAEESKFLADVVDHTVSLEDDVLLRINFEEEMKWLSEDEDDIDAAYEEFLGQLPNRAKIETEK